MNLIKIFIKYPDHEACIEHIENVRWGDNPQCPHCKSVKVGRKEDTDRIGRWNCHGCNSSFNVLSGTIFSNSRIELQKWFLAIGLIVNAKKSLSSCQLARDLDLNQKTAWFMQQRIRAEMATKQSTVFLQGVIEADETYIGGKPRKFNDKHGQNPRGRSTHKTPVIGAVERKGKVVARIANDLSGKGILKFLKDKVDTKGSLLITDEFKGYNSVKTKIPHAVINHSKSYVDGETHTNTIEGFWALLKRAWYGSHHHYKKHYTSLYVAEACWKYNDRANNNAFGTFLKECMS